MNTMLDKANRQEVKGDYKSLPEMVKLSKRLHCNEWAIFAFYPGMPTVEELKEALSHVPGTFAIYRTINGIGVRRLPAEIVPDINEINP